MKSWCYFAVLMILFTNSLVCQSQIKPIELRLTKSGCDSVLQYAKIAFKETEIESEKAYFSYLCAQALFCMDKPKEALRYINLTMDYTQGLPDSCLVLRSAIYLRIGNHRKVDEDFNKVKNTTPVNHQVYLYKAKSEFGLGNYYDALKYVSIFIDSVGGDRRAYELQGDAFREIGEESQSISSYESCFQLNDCCLNIKYSCALKIYDIYKKTSNENAEFYLRKSVDFYGLRRSDLIIELGELLFAKGKYIQADSILSLIYNNDDVWGDDKFNALYLGGMSRYKYASPSQPFDYFKADELFERIEIHYRGKRKESAILMRGIVHYYSTSYSGALSHFCKIQKKKRWKHNPEFLFYKAMSMKRNRSNVLDACKVLKEALKRCEKEECDKLKEIQDSISKFCDK
ncbi:MAG: hypothetical protein JJU02_06740 [Cryomorphaceae bacterium]|nr:hypothetical protein [Cryomorphaceae bacterium]